MPDLLNGSLAMFLNVASDGVASVQRGTTRGLATSGPRRVPHLPEVPTFAEGGLPGYEACTWHMLLAPAGTPPEVVRQLGSAVAQVLAEEPLCRRLEEQIMAVRPDTSPALATDWLQGEMAKWSQVIRQPGITAQ